MPVEEVVRVVGVRPGVGNNRSCGQELVAERSPEILRRGAVSVSRPQWRSTPRRSSPEWPPLIVVLHTPEVDLEALAVALPHAVRTRE